MADSPILEIPQMTPTSTLKETMVNDNGLALEQATNQTRDVDFTAGNVTLTATEFLRYFRQVATNLSVARTLFIPTNVREFLVDNRAGTNTLTVDITGSPGVSQIMQAGEMWMVNTDGTDVLFGIGGLPGVAKPTLGFWAAGVPGNLEVVGKFIFTLSFTLPSGLTGSYAEVLVAPTAAATWTIKKNGSSVGTVNFAIAATTATFTFATETTFAAGDDIIIEAQTTADTTMAGLSLSLKGI